MIKCTFENGGDASLRHAVVDILVLNDKDEILLVKRAQNQLLEGGKWAMVGGFVERDETTIKGAAREIFEETGWKVKNLKLLKINDNSDRPHEDRQNISFVYVCRGVQKMGKSDQESSEQKWFKLSDLPPKEQFAFDHFEDIQFYLKKKK